MNHKFLLLGIVVILLFTSCTLPFDVGEDEGDWSEYALEESSESSPEEPSLEEDEEASGA